ncbi:MAG TPA: CAP domain-containing protein [archaeon]|nr:CAP domain-containing protein [archaeon]
MCEYVGNTFFKLILLFIFIFLFFGLYDKGYLQNLIIVSLVLIAIILYLIFKLLYRRARLGKIIVLIVVIISAVIVSHYFSSSVFEKTGIQHYITGVETKSADKQTLSGTTNMIKTIVNSGENILESTGDSIAHSEDDSKVAFDYINELRKENGVNEISWDDKIYDLAKYKVDDMSKRNYFDHVDPDGKCVGSYAKNYGLSYSSDSFAENLFGYSSPYFFDQKESVDSWMDSRGHRYNLLYSGHKRGAIACNSQYCSFIGQGGSSWSCNTGEAGLQFWETVGKQPGEK